MSEEVIVVSGAREHNLKGIDVTIPKFKLVIFSGVSGSGKSSLAFDTVFAEGQRRYVESLSSYARQFLGQLEKPRYDRIRGLTPTIAIEQKSASSNPRSTVGTITEIHDYLRVLFARVGVQHCHSCGRPVARMEPAQIVREILGMAPSAKASDGAARAQILAPLARGRKGEYRDLFDTLRADGFVRVRVDGEVQELASVAALDKNRKHDIDVLVDRVALREGVSARLTDSVELALKTGKGRVIVAPDGGEERSFSEHLACDVCGLSFPELSPQLFSFNNPAGACPTCDGLGTALLADPDRIVPNPSLSLRQGAIEPWARMLEGESGWTHGVLQAVSRQLGLDMDTPFEQFENWQKDVILYGLPERVPMEWKSRNFSASVAARYEGVANTILRRFRETRSEEMRTFYQRYMTARPCETCHRKRLRPEALSVHVAGWTIDTLSEMTVARLLEVFRALHIEGSREVVAEELKKEIVGRLALLTNLGIGYLHLSRAGMSLSGGEAQRIRLASQLGSELTGVTYILDEPSIGLHPRDNGRLIDTLKQLRDIGNTVLVVEHDREAIMAADHILEFGPGAGALGGELVFAGTPQQMLADERSLTGAYLSGRKTIPIPSRRRVGYQTLMLQGASGNNLKGMDVNFPLGTFTVVTGVSGAGKSSLVTETLYPAVARVLGDLKAHGLPYQGVTGAEFIDKMIVIDQEPIGRTPRSNPSTYTKLFDHIRDLFSNTREARMYGYAPGRFSFNVRGGRCERCQGAGVLRVEMHFLADVFVTCEECRGRRFNDATLRVRYKDLSIADVLDLTIDEAAGLFANHPKIRRVLATLQDVGLGYLKLGQPSTTLSGGEAQRVKLSRELARTSTGHTLYIMDEPSTGLHMDDVRKLLTVVDRLVTMGNTVVMIEHNLDILKTADHLIDLGPEGGDQGGHVIACGTPEELSTIADSHTGKWLATVLHETSQVGACS